MGALDRPREADTERGVDLRALAYLSASAGMLRGHKYAADLDRDKGRLRVSDGDGLRTVEVECLRRADDSDRWWFSWGGGIWLCEADHPAEAVVQIKGALRRITSPWSGRGGTSW